MNKNDFRGFKQVFLFEFMTGIKKTAFKIYLAIICAIALLAMPIMVIIGNIKGDDSAKESAPAASPIESVYLYDETGLSVTYEGLNQKDEYADVELITDSDMSYDDAVNSLKEATGHNNIVIKTDYDSEKGFDLTIVTSKKSGISDSALQSFEEDFTAYYRDEVLRNLDVSEEDFEYLSKEFNVTVMKSGKDGSFYDDAGSLSSNDYLGSLSGMMALFMIINIAVSTISTSVATEKSSRVIEFLLTGTRPIALLSGKLAARLLETFITFFAGYSCYFLSQLICVFLMTGSTASVEGSGSVVTTASIWGTVTISKLLIAVLYFLAGIALYSIIGALTGASVSKLDELQDALKLYSFILLVCLYSDMFMIMTLLFSSSYDGIKTFLALFPLTGVFITPMFVLTGKLSVLLGLASLVIIIITTVATFILASVVYESMLLFQGKRLKIKDIVTLMKKQVVE